MKICVISSGSWGTALCYLLAEKGNSVNLWFRNEEKAKKAILLNENQEYLPGIPIPKGVNIVWDIEEAAHGCDFFIQGAPSKSVRETVNKFKPYIPNGSTIVNVAKGLEDDSLKTLSQVIEDVLPNCSIAALSGPSHAEEVAKHMPTTIISSSRDIKVAEYVQEVFMSEYFRVYTNEDIIGVELGGALKNVIALAAGISDGIGLGDNAKAALMTRGIKEIAVLGQAMGANPATFSGLSGIGDLIVTCTSMHSRNRRAGILLGQGKSLSETLAEVHMVVEGVNTTKVAKYLADKYNVEAPITNEVYNVIEDNKSPLLAVKDLMTRDKKHEHGSEDIMYNGG